MTVFGIGLAVNEKRRTTTLMVAM